MKWDEYIEDKIDNYLRNKLTEQERIEFEKEIAGDPDLKLEVDAQKLLMGAIVSFRKIELKEYIKKHTRVDATGAAPIWMRIAAAVILAVGAGFFVYIKQNRMDEKNKMSYQSAPAQPPQTEKKSLPLVDLSKTEKPKTENNPLTLYEQIPVTKENPDILEKNTGEISKNKPTLQNGHAAQNETLSLKKDEVNTNSVNPTESLVLGTKNYNSQNSRSSGSGAFSISPETDKMKANLLKKETTEDDTVKSDVLIKDTVLVVKELPANTKDEAGIKVNYWKSAINFKGYRYYHKELDVYGIDLKTKVQLVRLGENIYLNIKNNIYLLSEGDYFYDFLKPIKDTRLIKELSF